MRHIDCQKRISSLMDGSLDGPAVREALDHLTECPDCARAYEKMVSLNNALASVKISLADRSLASKVKVRISGESNSAGYAWNFSLLKQVPIWALIAILAVGVGDMAGKTLTETLNTHDTSHNLENLIQDNGESLTDVLIDFGQSENGR
ncbi:MAG: anti-sigma factor family protein [Desulfomonilaceae bacterium]